MYYGTIKKQRAKQAIIDAFFRLLKNQQFSTIKVTEIVKEAGVARVTYYRNFYYQEDIIKSYNEQLHQKFLALDNQSKHLDISNQNDWIYVLEGAFTILKQNRTNMLLLYQNGFSSMLQNMFNAHAEQMMNECKFADKYELQLILGGFLNIGMEWLKAGVHESPRQMAYLMIRPIDVRRLKK